MRKIVVCLVAFVLVSFFSPNLILADQTWDGGGGADTNWNTCTNWTNNTCPTTTDVAIFDGTSGNNSTINAGINVKGMDVRATYVGTVTQASGVGMSLGSSGFVQAGATFVGGDTYIDINGDFQLSGGSYTATSAITSITGSFGVLNAPTFVHHSGTILFDGATTANTTIGTSGVSLNLVVINRSVNTNLSPLLTINAGTTIPLGVGSSITLVNTNAVASGYNLTNNGTILVGVGGTFTANVEGNFTNNGMIVGQNTSLVMNGNLVNSGIVNMSSVPVFDFNNYGNHSLSNGSLTNNSGANWITASNPSFNIAGSFVINSASTFPTTITTLTLDGSNIYDTTFETMSITYVNPVVVSRSANTNLNPILTISAGTTLPLGVGVSLVNTSTTGRYFMINSGIITIGSTAVFSTNIDGDLTNNGTISGQPTSWIFNGNLVNAGTISVPSCSTFDFNDLYNAYGSLTQNASATFVTTASPTFNVAGSFVINSASTFPSTNVTLNLDGTALSDTTIDAPGISFATPVTINRSYNNVSHKTMTIEANTTLPLGNLPTISLLNSSANYDYNLINNGILSVGSSTLTINCDGLFTNGGTIGGSNSAMVANTDMVNNGTINMPSAGSFDFNSYNGAGIFDRWDVVGNIVGDQSHFFANWLANHKYRIDFSEWS